MQNTAEKKFPKFRKTSRVIKWLDRNNDWEYSSKNGRPLPEHIEQIFFKTSERAEDLVCNLVEYSSFFNTSRLSQNLEELLVNTVEKFCSTANQNDAVSYTAMRKYVEYLSRLKNIHTDPSERMVDALKGWDIFLLQWAKEIEKRLPQHLEDSLSNPNYLLKYAVEVLKGRLPEHLENLFYKDVHVATEYAFEVIRGFAPVKLPEHLHNFVVMKSFEHPHDRTIKAYMMASESDPNKIDNYSEET